MKAAAKADPITPESILKLRPARMRALGLSKQKLKYIRELARMTRDGEVNFEQCLTLKNDEVVEHLTRVKGVGVWTVHMFLMFALRRHDVLPTGDFGIRMAMKKAYGLEEMPKPAEMEKIAAPWGPYSSVACWYLWRSLDVRRSRRLRLLVFYSYGPGNRWPLPPAPRLRHRAGSGGSSPRCVPSFRLKNSRASGTYATHTSPPLQAYAMKCVYFSLRSSGDDCGEVADAGDVIADEQRPVADAVEPARGLYRDAPGDVQIFSEAVDRRRARRFGRWRSSG